MLMQHFLCDNACTLVLVSWATLFQQMQNNKWVCSGFDDACEITLAPECSWSGMDVSAFLQHKGVTGLGLWLFESAPDLCGGSCGQGCPVSKVVADRGVPTIATCPHNLWAWLSNYRTPEHKRKLTLAFRISCQNTIRTKTNEKEKHGNKIGLRILYSASVSICFSILFFNLHMFSFLIGMMVWITVGS